MSYDYSTEDAIRERAEKLFSTAGQECHSLCSEMQAVVELLQVAESEDPPDPGLIRRLNARFLAISDKMRIKGCDPCPIR